MGAWPSRLHRQAMMVSRDLATADYLGYLGVRPILRDPWGQGFNVLRVVSEQHTDRRRCFAQQVDTGTGCVLSGC